MIDSFEVESKIIIKTYSDKPLTKEEKNEIAFLLEMDLNEMSSIKLCGQIPDGKEGYRIYTRFHFKEVR